MNELETDSFVLVNADLSYDLNGESGHWLVFVRATNLIDEEARPHSSSLKDRVPLPGRSFNAGIRLAF
jgi:iron complex outermembrane receptor protein